MSTYLPSMGQRVYSPDMSTAEVLPTPERLRDWDWLAELKGQERSVLWLSRRTGAHYKAVYRYAWGHAQPPIAWLLAAAAALGVTEVLQETT